MWLQHLAVRRTISCLAESAIAPVGALALLRRPAVGRVRLCASTASPQADLPQKGSRQRWDITTERWADIKYEEEDFARFATERAKFRGEMRLRSDAVVLGPEAVVEGVMDWGTTLRGVISASRIGDCYTPSFQELVWERFALRNDLLQLFQIPVFEDKSVVQPIHSTAVPGEGTYIRVRMQSYWLALHVWLLHYKQHAVQEGEGLIGSAMCTLLTRRLFEFQWDRIRMLLHTADVPMMSVQNELQDLQEFVFGLCVALDDAFRDEASIGTAEALALQEGDLSGKLGLAPRVKYILWANVYSGGISHEESCLHELTVYLLRQRIAFEKISRDAFLSCRFDWADHPLV